MGVYYKQVHLLTKKSGNKNKKFHILQKEGILQLSLHVIYFACLPCVAVADCEGARSVVGWMIEATLADGFICTGT